MKIKCVKLLDADGRKVEFSPWLEFGRIYHVMSIFVDQNGKCSYGIINFHPEGEWPQMGRHQAECFEIISEIIPSNWREWRKDACTGVSPAAWQVADFYEAFYDHDLTIYPIFERERDIILREDP